jgi:hypothetical protein
MAHKRCDAVTRGDERMRPVSQRNTFHTAACCSGEPHICQVRKCTNPKNATNAASVNGIDLMPSEGCSNTRTTASFRRHVLLL